MRVRWERSLLIVYATFCGCWAALISSHKTDIFDTKAHRNSSKTLTGFNLRVIPMTDDAPMQCRQIDRLRVFRDGNCESSQTPIKDIECMGKCEPVPNKYQQWLKEYTQRVGRRMRLKQWRCVEDLTAYQKVTLICKDSTVRHYRVKVVKTCKCKLFNRKNKSKRRRLQRKKRKRNKRRRERKQKKLCRHRKHLSSNSPEL